MASVLNNKRVPGNSSACVSCRARRKKPNCKYRKLPRQSARALLLPRVRAYEEGGREGERKRGTDKRSIRYLIRKAIRTKISERARRRDGRREIFRRSSREYSCPPRRSLDRHPEILVFSGCAAVGESPPRLPEFGATTPGVSSSRGRASGSSARVSLLPAALVARFVFRDISRARLCVTERRERFSPFFFFLSYSRGDETRDSPRGLHARRRNRIAGRTISDGRPRPEGTLSLGVISLIGLIARERGGCAARRFFLLDAIKEFRARRKYFR